ncbi:UDP-N-acetylenolpyruvoylglucosamine reductase [Bacillus nakamurai]|uniref:UDP-N-acetylenolpyruvoylglucosamine reductase n=1 Tax=Bacillus nakamurai TaxID=1793963 RepID=A0A150F978_9BACI|nr:UDP-N-acetylmuramate dehydrogenase [Bacillus nakamurai]KXZ20537.1 UDP-N-acetylenolpyruvoylglucosamine reductase [Bacillus nakamurai]
MDYFQVLMALRDINHNMYIGISEPMANHTFIQTGGKADIYVKPENEEEAKKIVKYAFNKKIPITIIGNGSNVIIRDGGIRGIVMNLDNLNTISVEENKIIAQSGASIINVSQTALSYQLSGLEFACGIPGSVGGAIKMNAGAYGGEISDVLVGAKVLTMTGDILELNKSNFQFGYRTSIFEKENFIVLEAKFRLKKDKSIYIKEKMDVFTRLRQQKQPLEYPSCGSVFKRPPNHFAGKLIVDSGLQGVRIGGAEVSNKHAGFIVNVDNATSSDYLTLIQIIKNTVKDKFSIEMETEVQIIGEQ